MKKYVLIFAIAVFAAEFAAGDAEKWWCRLDFPIPQTNDLECAAAQLADYNRQLVQLSRVNFGAEDVESATNIWLALARLIGNSWTNAAIPQPIVYRSFGMVTNRQEILIRMCNNAESAKIRKYQGVAQMLDQRIKSVLKNAVASDAMSTFSTVERNTIVSNLVAAARITVDEAESLGMTNIVGNVGE